MIRLSERMLVTKNDPGMHGRRAYVLSAQQPMEALEAGLSSVVLGPQADRLLELAADPNIHVRQDGGDA